MVLKNISQKTIISKDLKIANSFIDSLLGLLRADHQSMLFYTRFGIHTLGLKHKIDVIVIDSKWKVVKFKKNLSPNNLFFWNPKFNMVIELPKDLIIKSETKIGDLLSISKK